MATGFKGVEGLSQTGSSKALRSIMRQCVKGLGLVEQGDDVRRKMVDRCPSCFHKAFSRGLRFPAGVVLYFERTVGAGGTIGASQIPSSMVAAIGRRRDLAAAEWCVSEGAAGLLGRFRVRPIRQ